MISETSINLLMQIPLAGIVILVVVLFLNYLRESEERNRLFIKEQREANNLATGRLAEEIKQIALKIESLGTCYLTHDLRAQNIEKDIGEIRKALSGRKKATTSE